MTAAKLIIEVTVGLSPDMIMSERCRRWSYTSVDYERDKEQGMVDLSHISDEAATYARSQMDPRVNNFVRLEWIWL